jgi:type II secretory pathway component PulK
VNAVLGNRRAELSVNAACRLTPTGGFVLVSVLWLLALLTVVTLVLLTTVRLDVRAAGQLTRHAEAEALADGLTRLVALRLGDRVRRPLTAEAFTVDGTPYACSHEEAAIEIAVTDVGGLVDLNMASVRLFEWLLLGHGLAADRAAALAAAIVDFRDADDLPTRNGAEGAAYQMAGLRHGPKNAPFESVTELDQVLGMDLALFARVRRVTTVYSRSSGIDPGKASPELRAIAEAAAIPAAADERTRIPAEFRAASRGRAFRVTVRVALTTGGRFGREAVIEPVRTAPLGFVLREWTSSGPVAAAPIDPLAGHAPCLPVLL